MTNVHTLPVPPRKPPSKRKARRTATPSKPVSAPLCLLAAVAVGTAGALLIALGLAVRLIAA